MIKVFNNKEEKEKRPKFVGRLATTIIMKDGLHIALNKFETLSKFELIKILEILAMHNLATLLIDRQQQKEYKNISNFVMNLRLKA